MARLVEDVEGIKVLDDQDRVVLIIGLDGSLIAAGDITGDDIHAVGTFDGDQAVAELHFPGSGTSATAVGSVVKKNIVFNAAGVTLGYIPIYSSIT